MDTHKGNINMFSQQITFIFNIVVGQVLDDVLVTLLSVLSIRISRLIFGKDIMSIVTMLHKNINRQIGINVVEQKKG